MMRRSWFTVVLSAAIAGCAGVDITRTGVAGRQLVAEPRATTRPVSAKEAPNAFTQEVFHYEPAPNGRADAEGWVERPVRFEVQHPYDLKLGERWSYDAATDTQDLWVLGTDKAHLPPPNRTTARTELRLIDPEYLPGTGLHKMECDLFIVPGTFATITQVFATGPMGMIVVDPEGKISDLRSHAVVATGMNGKWFHWSVVHDTGKTGAGAIRVYVDGKLADGEISANPSKSYYFKVGVYSRHGSERSEVKVRNLRVWWHVAEPPVPSRNARRTSRFSLQEGPKPHSAEVN
jgi:hypothetical protein